MTTDFRRRKDDGSISLDDRLKRIDTALGKQDERLDRLERRINFLMGGLAVLVAIGQFIGPIVDAYIRSKL